MSPKKAGGGMRSYPTQGEVGGNGIEGEPIDFLSLGGLVGGQPLENQWPLDRDCGGGGSEAATHLAWIRAYEGSLSRRSSSSMLASCQMSREETLSSPAPERRQGYGSPVVSLARKSVFSLQEARSDLF